MTTGQRSLWAINAVVHLLMSTRVLGMPNVALPTAQFVAEGSHPKVTAAPSPPLRDLRFHRRADGAQCASSCVLSAVTKSTNCRVDDYACGCIPENASKIGFGAEPCIVVTCGYAVYACEFDTTDTAARPR